MHTFSSEGDQPNGVPHQVTPAWTAITQCDRPTQSEPERARSAERLRALFADGTRPTAVDLLTSIRYSCPTATRILLESGANPNEATTDWPGSNYVSITPLRFAIRERKVAAARMLVEDGRADVNLASEVQFQLSPLQTAIWCSTTDHQDSETLPNFIDFLLTNGADTTYRADFRRPMTAGQLAVTLHDAGRISDVAFEDVRAAFARHGMSLPRRRPPRASPPALRAGYVAQGRWNRPP